MKPTQEQIDAALRYADDEYTEADELELMIFDSIASLSTSATDILAYAYLAKCEEVEAISKELRHIADLLDAHFNSGGSIAGLGTTNKARKLLETTP